MVCMSALGPDPIEYIIPYMPGVYPTLIGINLPGESLNH